jgi:hypothetical protein
MARPGFVVTRAGFAGSTIRASHPIPIPAHRPAIRDGVSLVRWLDVARATARSIIASTAGARARIPLPASSIMVEALDAMHAGPGLVVVLPAASVGAIGTVIPSDVRPSIRAVPRRALAAFAPPAR